MKHFVGLGCKILLPENLNSSHMKILRQALVYAPILVVLAGILWIAGRDSKLIQGRDYFKIQPGQISYFEDHQGLREIDFVASNDELFTPITAGTDPNFGFNNAAIWLKFEVRGNMIQDQLKILEVKNPLLNEIKLYGRDGSEIWEAGSSGDETNFSSRPMNTRNYAFPIELPSNQIREYFLKVRSGGEQLFVPLTIWSADAMAIRDNEDQLARGSYFGLILFVLLFNLFVYFIIREKSSLYYVYYNFFLFLLQLSLGGYAFQYLWPGSPYLTNIANPLFASLSVFALVRFSQHFLELKKHFPKVNRIYHYLGFVLLLNAGLSLIWLPAPFYVSVLVVNGLALLLNVAIIPTAIGVLKKGYKPARIFLAGFLLLILTVFGFILTNAGVIHSDFYADYGLLIGSASEVILLSLAIVVRFKSFRDQAVDTLKVMNKLQVEQNQMLENKVTERTREIFQQKSEIELQKEEILSSIRYAERIQKNILPTESDIRALFPDSFVIFQPKDIVSGDFYWAGRTFLNGINGPPHEVRMFATGDCTGHGVPGAMVSVLGCNLLRETVNQHPEENPAIMLGKLDDRLISAINGTSHEHAGDGMDIALWAVQMDTLELQFAGANNGISIWRNSEWIDLHGTRRPLGLRNRHDMKAFERHRLQLQPGDVIYAWTDGVTDQLGGERGKKLKTQGIKAFMNTVVHLSLYEQKQRIEEFLLQWRQNEEQLDDISFTAVRI